MAAGVREQRVWGDMKEWREGGKEVEGYVLIRGWDGKIGKGGDVRKRESREKSRGDKCEVNK